MYAKEGINESLLASGMNPTSAGILAGAGGGAGLSQSPHTAFLIAHTRPFEGTITTRWAHSLGLLPRLFTDTDPSYPSRKTDTFFFIGPGIAQVSVMGPCTYLVTGAVNDPATSVLTRVKQTYKRGGVADFYPGGTAIAFRQATNWASRQGFTEFVRARMKIQLHGDQHASLTKTEEILAGVIGGTLACWNHPFEVARIEAQVLGNLGKPVPGMTKVMRDIIRVDGVQGTYFISQILTPCFTSNAGDCCPYIAIYKTLTAFRSQHQRVVPRRRAANRPRYLANPVHGHRGEAHQGRDEGKGADHEVSALGVGCRRTVFFPYADARCVMIDCLR